MVRKTQLKIYVFFLPDLFSHARSKDNVLVGNQLEALLSDFGLAMVLEVTSGLTTSTFCHRHTVMYASPELIFKAHSRSLASDVWAFGCLILEVQVGLAPLNLVTDVSPSVSYRSSSLSPKHSDPRQRSLHHPRRGYDGGPAPSVPEAVPLQDANNARGVLAIRAEIETKHGLLPVSPRENWFFKWVFAILRSSFERALLRRHYFATLDLTPVNHFSSCHLQLGRLRSVNPPFGVTQSASNQSSS